MCGILGIHGVTQPQTLRQRMIALSKTLRHRGPDWSGCYVGKECVLTHERLAIVGVGKQRLFDRLFKKNCLDLLRSCASDLLLKLSKFVQIAHH